MIRTKLHSLRRRAERLLGNDTGATAIEYGLIVALIAMAIFGALSGFAGQTGGLFTSVQSQVDTAM